MGINVEDVEQSLREATLPGFRFNLLARGQARGMIWRGGKLPDESPEFSELLTYDLLAYGYSLLSHGLRLLENEGDGELSRKAFEGAASALEAVVANGEMDESSNFHRLVAASCFQLGRFSARAYSLLNNNIEEANLTVAEKCLSKLLIRDLDGLNTDIHNWFSSEAGSDSTLLDYVKFVSSGSKNLDSSGILEDSDDDLFSALAIALTDRYLSSISTAILGFERGEKSLIDEAIIKLKIGLDGASEFKLVSHWWVHRLTIFILSDLWKSSLHNCLPKSPVPGTDWDKLRDFFIYSLHSRRRAEIELWPSQILAASRVLNSEDNLVLSLPTSAGKTRIAEICILACLAEGKRVVFLTPLRALSAQTEVALLKTFKPLGKSVSSLYGSIGVNSVDIGMLNENDIVVATPEKFDFAMRNDSTLLDNVGLVVLDEGHMIGLDEREIRYEVQIQRLLNRTDAASRRIICLSAILPSGSQLDDFVNWLTMDKPDGLITNDWRPTRLRYGEVEWKKAQPENGDKPYVEAHAQLNISIGEEKPFVPKFLTATFAKKGRKLPFPNTQQELCLATAWRLVEDGQSVLIYCPLRISVEPFAKTIVKLHGYGLLQSVLTANPTELSTALMIGEEWFGKEHPILLCLKLGIAIHHGALPTPYRKEIEKLLREGILKITISSPTLAQGLNLTATTLIFYGLMRNMEVIKTSEFRNVVGRAGRAFVDLEGLVLFPNFKGERKSTEQWKAIIADSSGKEMESGLQRLIISLLVRMHKKIGGKLESLIEYVANNAACEFPEIPNEKKRERDFEIKNWEKYISSLDTAILSLLGDADVLDEEIEMKLDEILSSSLWERRISKRKKIEINVLKSGLLERAKFIWSKTNSSQRKGYFLAGIGFKTGQLLDENANILELYLIHANAAILASNNEKAIENILNFAEIVFTIPPFAHKDIPGDWKEIITAWLSGNSISFYNFDDDGEVLEFIEQAVIYKLTWAMEAVRVRGVSHNDIIGDFLFEDYELSVAVACVETGTLNQSAALLMRSGFVHRSSAIQACLDTEATFTDINGLKAWVDFAIWDWFPKPEIQKLWSDFINSFKLNENQVWRNEKGWLDVNWMEGVELFDGQPLRVVNDSHGNTLILSPSYENLGQLETPIMQIERGLLLAKYEEFVDGIEYSYFGEKVLR